MSPETITRENTLFIKISQNAQVYNERDCGWWDDAVCGGLVALVGIPRPGSACPDSDSLGKLYKAMDSEESAFPL